MGEYRLFLTGCGHVHTYCEPGTQIPLFCSTICGFDGCDRTWHVSVTEAGFDSEENDNANG